MKTYKHFQTEVRNMNLCWLSETASAAQLAGGKDTT